MKRTLGLDLGTNSVGWALIKNNFTKKEGEIIDLGSRIIPMDQKELSDFNSGNSISATAERTKYRGTRRLYERNKLRRERLHRVLNILNFLPKHYKDNIDFDKKLGQFKKEVKLNYASTENGESEFLFMNSYHEMLNDFKNNSKIPFDWALYYLRKKSLKEKIEKEELAWIILNFNQKRGYYQLRGDELTEDDDKKDVKYYQLTVKDVVATDDKNNKGTWYHITFNEIDAVYKRQSKDDIKNLIGTKKEFIITKTINKDNSIKYNFRAPKENDWGLIKKKTEQELDNYLNNDYTNKSVGSFIYENLLSDTSSKIRGKLIRTIERKYYKKELKAILSKQSEYHSELKDVKLYNQCLQELYKHNDAHKNNIKDKDFNYLFLDDIIFYQRPLKSQKGLISSCTYENRTYYKTIFDVKTNTNKKVLIKNQPIKAISKSHPLYQEFRLWQWLHNLKIYQNKKEIDGNLKINYDVTNEILKKDADYTALYDFLKEKKEINLTQFLKYFSDKKLIPKQKKDNLTHRWNYQVDKVFPMCETHNALVNRLKKVVNFNIEKDLLPEMEENLWHINYSIKNPVEFEKALKKFAKKFNIDKESFIKAFKKLPPYKNEYGSFSYKAISKLLPLMRIGKYWNPNEVSNDEKKRIAAIMERIQHLDLSDNFDQKKFDEAVTKISDDDIPKQLIKAFFPIKDKENYYSGLNTYQVGYAVYNRHSKNMNTDKWHTSNDIQNYLNNFKQHSLRNPVVEKIVLETLRTVKDIWDYYGQGKEGFFDEIHIELGRELKNPKTVREKITKRNVENERTNTRIRKLLQELINEGAKPHSPSHQEILKIYESDVVNNNILSDEIERIRKNNTPSKKDIQKYKLWLEQKYISPYTGETIPLSKLFTTDYQIEHIIPQSRFFDNSFNNKVICEAAVNQLKDNQTGYEFIQNHGGEIVKIGNKTVTIFKWEAYQQHCESYFDKNKTKLNNLITPEIPDDFINRQLNDSRYISKLVKGLLSKIVKEPNEKEATSKNLISVTGAITGKLKQDWGLNDKWNEIILPRFKRLNKLTQSNDFTYINEKGIEVPTVSEDLINGFNKKRIDHRHHALDALVIAACTRKHIQYINSLNNDKLKYSLQLGLMIKNKQGNFTKYFQLPWKTFPIDAKKSLENTIISFKKNIRVINKTNNKYWKFVQQPNGKYKKSLVPQIKGESWAIRKPMHKETISGKINEQTKNGKIITAVRTPLLNIKTLKHIKQITDSGIRDIIIPNHLKKYIDDKGKPMFDKAFSPEGIKDLNDNIITLNNGKKHQPIYKVRLSEEGSKFTVSDNKNSPKHKKYVEAAKGTNLFFAVYWDAKNQKRVFETVPLVEVIAHQKEVANLPKDARTPIPIKNKLGTFLFYLSPNDLVYVPTEEEQLNPKLVDFTNLNKEQVNRIYSVNDFSTTAYFTPNNFASKIADKEVDLKINKKNKLSGSYDSKTASIDNKQIKDICWKLEINRLGRIENVIIPKI
ncbi:MAG TPA: CRISPR-associated protein Csn1 [Flavobacteriia bacterium]|nr:CRISPR-associated protein Csn1 [Flavobacteriia bacterium]